MRQRTRALFPLLAVLFAAAASIIAGAAGAQTAGTQTPGASVPHAAQAEIQRKAVAKRTAADAGRGALAQTGLTGAQIDDLIETLESPTAREKFLSRLKTLRAATPAAQDRGAPESQRIGGRLVAILSDRINDVSEHLVAGATLLLDAPRLLHWVESRASDPRQREIWLRVLWKVAAVLAAGLAVEWGVRRILARPRAAVEGRKRDGVWLRLPFLIVRTFLDILPIAAFAGAAYIALPFFEPDRATRLVTIALVNASVIARAVLAMARMFFVPGATNLRIVAIDDENANYIVVWIRRLTGVAVYGYFVAEAALLLGMPRGGYLVLSKLIGLLLALLAIVFVLQNRQTVAGWIRGPDESGAAAGVKVLRRRLADIWHVLAVVYIASVYLVWALEIEGGFDFVFRATALSVVILSAARLAIYAARNAIDRGLGLRPELVAQFPGLAVRANRYLAILNISIVGAIAVVSLFAILEAWGVDSFSWIGTPTGRRITGSIVSSAVVIVVSIVFWEMVSSVIERYLARGELGELSISARAKTLLPLLRKALLIIVSTIVSFILLAEVGVNIGPLLAGAGVVGLAVGFGSQTLVKDVITGIFILAEDQFAVGDVVQVCDKAGVVEDITIRTIRLRDLSGNVHIIPFSSVTTVENMTKDFSRYVFDVGIAYRENVDEVIDVLRALGEEMQTDEEYGPLILEPLEILGLDSFGDSAVVVRARFTTRPIKQWQVGREFNRRMKRKFDEMGIEIPFPHQTVYFGEAKGGGAPPAYVKLAGGVNALSGTDAAAPTPSRTDPVDRPSDDDD